MDKLNQVLKIQLPRMSLESGIKIALMILSLIFVMFATYYMVNIGNNYVDDKRKVRLNLREILKYVLIFAGITDRCGLALVLTKAPWNKV